MVTTIWSWYEGTRTRTSIDTTQVSVVNIFFRFAYRHDLMHVIFECYRAASGARVYDSVHFLSLPRVIRHISSYF